MRSATRQVALAVSKYPISEITRLFGNLYIYTGRTLEISPDISCNAPSYERQYLRMSDVRKCTKRICNRFFMIQYWSRSLERNMTAGTFVFHGISCYLQS